MSDRGDAARRSGVPTTYGSVGPEDPRADPATVPHLRPPAFGARRAPGGPPGPAAGPAGPVARPPSPATAPDATPAPGRPGRSLAGVLYAGLVLAVVIGVFLLVFIVQNDMPVEIRFLGFTNRVQLGVALLLAAIAGALLVAILGSVRILQLRRAVRRKH